MRQPRLGSVQQKILLLLLGGLALGFAGSPNRYFKIIKSIGKEWKEIDRRVLYRAIKNLYCTRLIEEHQNPDGSLSLVLSDEGRKRALTFKLDEMKIVKPEKWDKKWRIVVFDLPETRKKERDSLRHHLKRLGFYKLQKSVFVHPYPCGDEMDYLIEFHHVRPWVRQLTSDWIDNELHLRYKFNLL
jgi:DNA-binding transcriptional regulator PaaX